MSDEEWLAKIHLPMNVEVIGSVATAIKSMYPKAIACFEGDSLVIYPEHLAALHQQQQTNRDTGSL